MALGSAREQILPTAPWKTTRACLLSTETRCHFSYNHRPNRDHQHMHRFRCVKTLPGQQARYQLGTPGGAKSFLRGTQFFKTMSNGIKLCPTHFSRGPKNFAGGKAPLQPSGYGPAEQNTLSRANQRERHRGLPRL